MDTFYMVLIMVCYTQNYWVFGLRPSSGILKSRYHIVSETASVSVFRCAGRLPLLGPTEIINLNQWTTYVSITAAI
jgi:hypothetical protein